MSHATYPAGVPELAHDSLEAASDAIPHLETGAHDSARHAAALAHAGVSIAASLVLIRAELASIAASLERLDVTADTIADGLDQALDRARSTPTVPS